jgi:hypothetical protein
VTALETQRRAVDFGQGRDARHTRDTRRAKTNETARETACVAVADAPCAVPRP